MELNVTYLLFVIAGVITGVVITWLILRRLGRLRQGLQAEVERRSAAEAMLTEIPKLENILLQRDRAIATFQDERKDQGERIKELETRIEAFTEMETKMSTVFRAAATQALNANNSQFLDLAEEKFKNIQRGARSELENRKQAIEGLLRPLGETLSHMDEHTRALENSRTGAYATLIEQISSLQKTQQQLKGETGNLVKALRAPHVRGRWGELQLQRLVEMAGMIEHCHFVPQDSTNTDTGRLRPDMKVFLPNQRMIIVDSKVPLQAYLDAIEAEDDGERAIKLGDHARQLRAHLNQLSSKAYQSQFDNTPDFVVMFLPLESAFSAALTQDPALIEDAISESVIMATPTTLLALLKAVHFGWRHEKITQSAREIKELGETLYTRVSVFVEHFDKIGGGLKTAEKAYNAAVGSLDTNLLVTMRKIKELAAIPADEIQTPEVVEIEIRQSKVIAPIADLPERDAENRTSPNGR